ncbi:hypothetical protein HYX11_05560 [Candidatus Woesearchaeota archaeon]|nr:hypothetical protein [Candidatus Woesearchaeota archaeon]
MTVRKYICAGTCGGEVTETQFKRGKNRCAAKRCTHYGKLLLRKGINHHAQKSAKKVK